MTAEIAMLNREAVALAADSAVTMQTESGYKILQSANKIFTLSKYHPVGIMVYGSAHLMGAPWELLIKTYRRELGAKSFGSIDAYAIDFVRFLSESREFFPEEMQVEHFYSIVTGSLQGLLEEIFLRVQREIGEHGPISEATLKKIQQEMVDRMHRTWKAHPFPADQPTDFPDRIRTEYDQVISRIINDTFQKLPLTKSLRSKLADIAVWLSCKLAPTPSVVESGIVIAGYGDEDVYPSLRSYRVEAVLENQLIYDSDRHIDVADRGAAIVPFAQSEMVHAFMEGIEPRYLSTIEREMAAVLNRFAEVAADGSGLQDDHLPAFKSALEQLAAEAAAEFRAKSQLFREENFALPSLNITELLPKDELAAMAESLVNLTAFRRRMSLDAETVGGPVDVAVISKGDGFIWIRRKHYFSKELNPHFVQNYFREDRHGREEHENDEGA